MRAAVRDPVRLLVRALAVLCVLPPFADAQPTAPARTAELPRAYVDAAHVLRALAENRAR